MVLIAVGLIGGATYNKTKVALSVSPETIALPDPGLVPGDFWYFLDEWSESIEEFFTFNDEARGS